MGAQASSDGQREAPVPLSRQRVVAAAMDLAQREGLAALTMRRLADELGVTPMATYRHVTGKDDLLQAMTERIWEELLALPVDDLPSDPVELVVVGLTRIRRHLLSYGELARVAAWRPTPSPSVVANVAVVVEVLRAMGFDDDQIPAVYATLVGTALSLIQFEVARADFERAAEAERPTAVPEDVAVDPASRAVVEQIAVAPDRAVLFEFAVRRLVEGLLSWRDRGEPAPDLRPG